MKYIKFAFKIISPRSDVGGSAIDLPNRVGGW